MNFLYKTHQKKKHPRTSKGDFMFSLRYGIYLFLVFISSSALASDAVSPMTVPKQETLKEAFGHHHGCFILTRCKDGKTIEFNHAGCDEKLPPCSTFKIWNSLIGLETKLIDSPDAPFYKWDGEKRFMPEWNKDLTLREAFRVSCVPPFQALARNIGAKRMQDWIDKIDYGDRNTSAGIDKFWLTSSSKHPILITPRQQVELLKKLLADKLPFSARSRAVLEDIMLVKKLDHGNLYGKTGSGIDKSGNYVLGWFVGFLRYDDETYVFACTLQGPKLSGKEARATVETIITKTGWH